MLETTTLGVPFCDLGRKGKIGVQVCFQALGGLLGVLMRKLGRAGILCSGRGVGEEQMVRGGGCRQDKMESLQFAGFSLHGASLIVEHGL